MSECVTTEFPIWGLLPKKETGVTQFLTKYPEFDGRGVTIAIFDSGVDPGAAGLQTTSDGKVKVIERYDCSGAGDVDTSTVVKEEDGYITGITGRKLTIPSDWKNPSGEYHVGAKSLFEIYPSKLLERVQKLRREKIWDPKQKVAVATAVRKVHDYDANNGDTTPTPLEKLAKDELDAEVDVLTNLDKKFVDLGPTFDCVVFNDGSCWRACIDTSEKGDLSNCPLLGEYTITQDYAPLTEEDQLNCSINVYDDGNVLEIVGMCSAHGTHVASIAAAHFPDAPEKNGVAPGAQIISLTIGDNRLISMETGTALVRAMIKVSQRKTPVHVINMSYGEHAHWSCSGRLGELMAEVVGKHGITWVASAGNHGPALCTISTPPDISTDCIVGVGAYVSPEMMIAEYAMREKLAGMPYTWSSRGPTVDGGMGISVCAPGGAITSVPNFTLRGAQLMNGTSMAAPHVSGAVAVLISGLIQKGLRHSPHSIKRALENTAKFLPESDEFAQGHGLLQVEKAFEYLCQWSDAPERDVLFSIKCGSSNAKGIHLRGGRLLRPNDNLVTVEPIFHEDAEKRDMINFNMRLCLVTSSSWVQTASHLDLTNLPRSLSVRVDPAGLAEGVHTSCVRAYDTLCVEKGPVFRIPITVVKPTVQQGDSSPDLTFSNVLFKPNTICRHFIRVPNQSTWVVIRLRSTDEDKFGKFVIHCVQLRPKQVCKTMEFHKMLNLSSTSDVVQSFPCRGGLILEVVIAKFWASLGDMAVDYSVEFRGATPECPSVTMHGADGIHAIEMMSGLKTEEIAPVVSLKSSVLVLRPTESKVTACCKERDVFPPCRQIYENTLSYQFHINKSTEITPSCPLLSDLLYESEFESQMWMLYDTNKKLIAVGDAYPCKYSVKVEKGDYAIRLNVRHERRDLLEKMSDMPLLISQKLCQALSLDVFASRSQAMIHGKKMAGALMPPGHYLLPFYISPLINDKSTKNIPFGHYLQGTITYSKDELGKKADVYPFKYIIPDACKKNKDGKDKDKDKEKSKADEFSEAIRDLRISWLAKLDAGSDAETLYEELSKEFPDNMQVHTAMLACLDPTDLKRPGVLPFIGEITLDESKQAEMRKTCESIIEVADRVLNTVDSTQLLSQLGIKTDGRADAAKTKQLMEKQKSVLVEALLRKGCALARILALDLANGTATDLNLEPLNEIWRELIKFVDPFDLKVIHFMMWHAVLSRQFCRALRFISKLSEEKPSKELDLKAAEIYRVMQWSHAEQFVMSHLPAKYPSSFRRF